MPIATLRDATASDLLTSISVAYVQDADGFVASRVFPIVPVDENSGNYWLYNKGDMLRSDAKLRAPGTRAAQKTVGVSTATYLCQQWALDHKIPDEILRSRKSPFSDQVAVSVLTQDLLIRRDLEWATTFMSTGVWANEKAGGGGGGQVVSWDQGASANILEDIAEWHDTVKAACGRRPNVAVITSDVWQYVKNNADVVDRIKYTQRGQVGLDTFAALIEVDEVLLLDSVQVTSAENATAVTAGVATEKFLLAYRSPTPDILVPSAGYVFSWPEFDGVREAAAAGAAAITSWYDQAEEAQYYRGKAHFDMKVVASDAAFLGYNLLS